MKDTSVLWVTPQEAGQRLDIWIKLHFPQYSRQSIQRAIKQGHILVNKRWAKPGYSLRGNEWIEVSFLKETPAIVPAKKFNLEILYEDEFLLVLNKPKGMLTHPTPSLREGTLVNALLARYQSLPFDAHPERAGIVHRLDRDTSGALIVAKRGEVFSSLKALFKKREVTRVYLALVHEIIKEEKGVIEAPIGRKPNKLQREITSIAGKEAITFFRVLERLKNTTLVEIRLKTGRTHQIRLHFSYIGHPIVGDTRYGKHNIDKAPFWLHAYQLKFFHPIKREEIMVTAPLPQELKEFLEKARSKKND
jgi:23S rRNA pseudouridine1911/1915/1917 synthase